MDEVWVLGFKGFKDSKKDMYYYKGSGLTYDGFVSMCDNIIEATKFDTYSEATDMGENHDLIAVPITEADYVKELLCGM